MMDSEIEYCNNCIYSLKLYASNTCICTNEEVTLTHEGIRSIEAKHILFCKALDAKHEGPFTKRNPRRAFRTYNALMRWL